MAAATDDHDFKHGEMDIDAQKGMFSGFLKVVEWSSVLLAMLLGLLVFAFAMGFGWFAGLAVWVVIGVAAGFLMNLGMAWWLTVIGSTVLFAIGGAIALGVNALL
jgi:hypothetical protein